MTPADKLKKARGLRKKERSNRARQEAAEMLASFNLAYRILNSGYHIVVEDAVDFWPTTGKWYHRNTGTRGLGIESLREELAGIASQIRRPPVRAVSARDMYLTPIEYLRTGELWTGEEVEQLQTEFDEGVTVVEICRIHARSPSAIVGMLEKMNRVVNRSGRVYRLIFWGVV